MSVIKTITVDSTQYDIPSAVVAYDYSSTISCAVGDTSATFTDANILATSEIVVQADNSSNSFFYTSITVSAGSCTITFPALTEATDLRLKIWKTAEEIVGSGGLADLMDVDITDAQDGQIVEYDSATRKWVNATLSTVAKTGSYTDLSNKPTIPTALSQMSDDATHRVVTDTEKSTWNSKASSSDLSTLSTTVTTNNTAQNNKHKVTSKQVATTGWTSTTTAQSGTTLYKKTIALSHVYVTSPIVDIGASGVLPTVAQQEAYDLLQYVTINGTTLTLYGSAIPSTSYYINITGAD